MMHMTGDVLPDNTTTEDTPRKTTKAPIDHKQVTIPEKWGISTKRKATRVELAPRKPKRQPRHKKRLRGKRDNICAKCHHGGRLVECDTCTEVYHRECDADMPRDVEQPQIEYHCPTCRQEGHHTIQPPEQHRQDSLPGLLADAHQQDDSDGEVTISEKIRAFIQNIQGRKIIVLGDGHCLRRCIGKLMGLHPGEIVRYMRNKCKQMVDNQEKLLVESDYGWYTNMAYGNRSWDNIANNVWQFTSIHANINELQLWVNIHKGPLVVLNVGTDEATIYVDTLTELPKISQQTFIETHVSLCDKYSKQPMYLIFNPSEIHYNAIVYVSKDHETDQDSDDEVDDDDDSASAAVSCAVKDSTAPCKRNPFAKRTEDITKIAPDMKGGTGSGSNTPQTTTTGHTRQKRNHYNETEDEQNGEQTQTASRLKRLRPSTDTNQQRQQITGHNHDQEGHTTQNQQQGKTETHTAELSHLKRKSTVNVKQQAEETRNKYKRKK